MRIHRLELTGVGPFLRPQVIDFDDLAASGLFLIDGATGTGKTTIIDAIVYALFGDVSGGADSTGARIRSSFCGEADPTGVALDFTVDGRRHRITRVPIGARDPEDAGRPASSKPARQVLTEFRADGSDPLVLVRSNEIRVHVEALLTMSSDQFRQLVVLPQGRFAELLRMTPTDRLTALASLLDHDEFFTRVQDDLRQQGVKADDERRAAGAVVQKAAQQLAGRLRAHLAGLDPQPDVDFTDAAVGDDARAAAVDAIVADLTALSTAADADRAAQAVATETLRASAAAARTVALAVSAVVGAVVAVEAATLGLDPVDVGVDPARLGALIAELSVREGSLGEHAEWEARADDRAAERVDLVAQQRSGLDGAHDLRSQKDRIPLQRAALEADRAAAQKLAGTVESARDERTRLAGLVAKADTLDALLPQLAQRYDALRRAQDLDASASAAATQAHDAWIALLDHQRAEQAVGLAALLQVGAACPVCGSVEHPWPALPRDGQVLVTDPQVDDARTAAENARSASRAATAAVELARGAWQQCETDVAALRGALDGGEPDVVRGRHAQSTAMLEAAVAAEASLLEFASRFEDLDTAEAALDEQIAECDARVSRLSGVIATRDQAERDGRDRIRAATGDAESATCLLATIRGRIAALTSLRQAHTDLSTALAALPADQRDLTPDRANELAEAATAAADAADAALDRLARTANTLSATVADAKPMAASFTRALADRRAVEARTATACSMAQLAAGSNIKRLPLRSYALQRRFASVLAAATVHLERMSSGRFSFELRDEGGTGHAGLGIWVHDAWTGHKQEPKSLSGGETFYAALSLALGLADVVRGEAGGSALETLFIDEGFGSLDPDTLHQVLDQLDAMRSGGRVVGVISHVTEMKESIADRIEVRRGADRTSTVNRPG